MMHGMYGWLDDNLVFFLGMMVAPSFIFCLFDYMVNMAFKLAFFGRSNLRIGGGKFNG